MLRHGPMELFADKREFIQFIPDSNFQEADFLDTIRSIKSNGNKILFDPGWPTNGWNTKEKESALNIAQLSDIFSPNLKETLAISRSTSLDNALNYFKKHGVSSCVVKRGEKGAGGFIDGEKVFSQAFRFGEVKDTVGAGDMFNAALVKGLSENWEIEKSLSFATLYASLGITRIGKMRYPSFKEAYSIFKSKMGV